MIVAVYYHVGGCECCAFSQMIVVVYYHAGECECFGFSNESISDVSVVPF